MKQIELAYMASALAMMSHGLELPSYYKEKPKSCKRDQKKCKSCKHFHKTEYNCHCSYSSFVSPMDVACNHYKKQKK